VQLTPPHPTKPISSKAWLLLGLLGLVWGSSYVLIKKGLEAFDPEQVACLRIGITAIAFSPVFFLRFKQIDWSKLKYFAIVGFAGSFFPAFLFSFAQTQISSSITGVLSSLTPLFTLALGILFFKTPFFWTKVLGVLVGLAGAVLLIIYGKEAGSDGNIWYGLLVVLASLLYASSANTVGTYLQDMNALTISAVSFMMIGIPAIAYLFYSDFTAVLVEKENGWAALGYIGILSIFGTVIATVLFFKLVQITDAVFSSMVSYLIPLVAIMWGAVVGEPITFYHLIGVLLILSGVYISRK
jgi:drug/metabolite transporter (DMT)-like permease